VPFLPKQIALAKGCKQKKAYDFAFGQPGETDTGLVVGKHFLGQPRVIAFNAVDCNPMSGQIL